MIYLHVGGAKQIEGRSEKVSYFVASHDSGARLHRNLSCVELWSGGQRKRSFALGMEWRRSGFGWWTNGEWDQRRPISPFASEQSRGLFVFRGRKGADWDGTDWDGVNRLASLPAPSSARGSFHSEAFRVGQRSSGALGPLFPPSPSLLSHPFPPLLLLRLLASVY